MTKPRWMLLVAVASVCAVAAGCRTLSGLFGDDLPEDVPGLIEALASPNYFPRAAGQDLIYPDGFDHGAQKRVRRAEQRLRDRGPAAFPDLVAKLEDARYAYSEYYDQWRNPLVGEVCFYIIEDQVDFDGYDYKTRLGADGKQHEKPSCLWSICTQGKMQEWWKARAGKTLTELQTEAVEWTVAEEKKIGFKDRAQEEQVLGPLLKRLGELKPAR